jgi:hypothetical protein
VVHDTTTGSYNMNPFTMFSPLTQLAIGAALAIALLGGVYYKGKLDGEAKIEAAVAKERADWQDRVREVQKTHDKTVSEVRAAYTIKIGPLLSEIDRLRKFKPGVVYVPTLVDKPVNKGFVDMVNAAAAGVPLPEAPVGDPAATTSVKLSSVANSVAANYYSCNATIVQLESLQKIVTDFIDKQGKLTK